MYRAWEGLCAGVAAGSRTLGLHGQPDEVLHEDLERDVVGDNDGRVLATARSEALACGVVRCRRVHLRGNEAGLGASGVGLDVSGHWEAVAEDLLGVLRRCLQQRLEVRILLFFLVAGVVPGLDHLPPPDDDVEESVQQQDHVRLQRRSVKQDRLWRALVERILQQSWLDHDQRIHGVLAEDDHAVISRLIRARVKGLQEVAPPQVVHKLWKDRQLRCEMEGRWVILSEVCEPGHQANKHPIDPAQHVQGILVLALADCVPGHEHCCSLLVESRGDVAHVRVGVAVRHGRDPEALPAGGVQVARLELQVALLALRHGVRLLVCHLEVETDARALVHGSHDPLARATLPDLGLRDARPLLAKGGQATDSAAALELAGREDLDLCVESQLQVPSLIAIEDLAEGFFEHVHAE
mmetsp:Transcript_49388/g.141293  ORF Transcript_49388/g.141293 Transcript_49388/m.141293 type:complete len:410 (-) Transcript_49388:1172-2401(-)